MSNKEERLKEFRNESSPNSYDEFVNAFKTILPKEMAEKLEKAIAAEMAIPPKIAVIGKSGVGKTSTINSLFNVEWHMSEVSTGTTAAQTETFKLKGEGKLSVIDMPGLGDSIAKDREFEAIYKEILPDVDVVLYIIQADDRGLGEDERIIRDVVIPSIKGIEKKIVIGLNKVDLIGENEGLEWDDLSNLPSEAQEKLIDAKCNDIVKRLSKNTGISKDRITFYSAVKRYRLYYLLYSVVIAAGDLGWKVTIDPKSWVDLMDDELKEETRKMQQQRKESKKADHLLRKP